jgi:hypothetical protein
MGICPPQKCFSLLTATFIIYPALPLVKDFSCEFEIFVTIAHSFYPFPYNINYLNIIPAGGILFSTKYL